MYATTIADPDWDFPCDSCGSPLSPHAWTEGQRLCDHCEVLDQEFQAMLNEELERELRYMQQLARAYPNFE